MKYTHWVICFALLFLLSIAAQGQSDSIPVKITFAKHINDSTYYQVKIGKERVNIVCCCEQRHKAGDVVMTARKDIEFLPTKRKLFQ